MIYFHCFFLWLNRHWQLFTHFLSLKTVHWSSGFCECCIYLIPFSAVTMHFLLIYSSELVNFHDLSAFKFAICFPVGTHHCHCHCWIVIGSLEHKLIRVSTDKFNLQNEGSYFSSCWTSQDSSYILSCKEFLIDTIAHDCTLHLQTLMTAGN